MGLTNSGKIFGDAAELMKWKLSAAVAFSSVTGYFLFAGDTGNELPLVAAGVFLLASGSAALNQFTERKIDALMQRTMNRPLPSLRMRPCIALLISAALLLTGVTLLAFAGVLPLILGIINVLLYNVIYTGLKKITALAIVPGALVGAVPPLIGYAAAGGAITDTGILLFSLFIFLWQLPHFWLLLIRYGGEYENAGIKTIYSVLSPSQISRLVFFWIAGSSLLLWSLTFIFLPLEVPAALILMILNVAFIILFFRTLFNFANEKSLKNAFILVNSFTLVIMIILIVTS
jgi:protoheme IX farnesyltransferase